jgi:predicted O-methyltransferase YrrM
MQVSAFVTVVQRRAIQIDAALLPLFGPLFSIETHMSMEERVALLATALDLPRGFVACEVGSYMGASACFLAGAASLAGGHLHCVDVWDNRAMGLEAPRDTFAEFQRHTAPFAQFLTSHRGESGAISSMIPGGLDLLFLDGDHAQAAVLSDLRSYVPKLKPGGILLLHDFTYASVQAACAEFRATQPLIEGASADTLKIFRKPHLPGDGR